MHITHGRDNDNLPLIEKAKRTTYPWQRHIVENFGPTKDRKHDGESGNDGS